MKNIGWIFVFITLLSCIGTSYALGPYEMGRVELGQYKCRWTTSVRKSCFKADMQKIYRDFTTCLSKHMQQKQCNDKKCIDRESKEGLSNCCMRTGGTFTK